MKFILGILFGFALGVVVGLLLAPQPGEATRTQISEQGVNLTEQVRSRANSLSGDLRARFRGSSEVRRYGRAWGRSTRLTVSRLRRHGNLGARAGER